MNIRLATTRIDPSRALWGPVVRDGLARDGQDRDGRIAISASHSPWLLASLVLAQPSLPRRTGVPDPREIVFFNIESKVEVLDS